MQKIERMYIPQKTKKTEYLEGSAGEIAKENSWTSYATKCGYCDRVARAKS